MGGGRREETGRAANHEGGSGVSGGDEGRRGRVNGGRCSGGGQNNGMYKNRMFCCVPRVQLMLHASTTKY